MSPILRDGELQGAVCTFIDITERRWAQEQQNLLVRELNHRIKNLFAVTSGMIALSARSAATPKQYAANIQGRLDALAIAHNLILPNPAGRAAAVAPVTHLDALLQHILAPYVAARDPGTSARLIVDGPVVALGPRAVTTLALVLHELATNAAKYGALSVEDGSIRTVWSCVDDVLAMKWVETGGPPVSRPPAAEGFGTVICNYSVRNQLGGTVSYTWKSTGLLVDLSIPLERLGK